MDIKRVISVYFSPTGSTGLVAKAIAEGAAGLLSLESETIDFTLPCNRDRDYQFESDDLIVFATPVYAGRIPNKTLPFVQSMFKGNKTPVILAVTYGNRSYDNGLMELKLVLANNGFIPVGGAAVPSRHVFSPDVIGKGNPTKEDFLRLKEFGAAVVRHILKTEGAWRHLSLKVPGTNPVGPYYVPKGLDGQPTVFLKAKPKTKDACDGCGLCVSSCPMGSINPDNPKQVDGVCIKCQACVLGCKKKAKYFDDEAFLSHVKMLEAHFTGKKDLELFLEDD